MKKIIKLSTIISIIAMLSIPNNANAYGCRIDEQKAPSWVCMPNVEGYTSAVVAISKDDVMKHVTEEEAGLRLFIEAFAQLAQRIGTKSLFNDKVNISYKYLKDGKDLIKNITLEYENTYVKYTKIGDNTTIEPSSSFSLDKFGKLLEKEKVLVKTFNTNKSGFLLVGLPVE